MPSIRQHRPAYFTGYKNEVVEFATLADLLAIPFVANFTTGPNFHRFSITDNAMLMAEYDSGQRWFVVGFLEGKLPTLPEWRPIRSGPLCA
jgi:hypothetical protein